MKTYIEGKSYNTETAIKISEFVEGVPEENGYRHEVLYKKRSGEFFVHGISYDSHFRMENIRPLTTEKVKMWAIRHMSSEEYESFMAKRSTLDVVSVRLIPDKQLYTSFVAESPEAAIDAVREELKLYDREVFAVLNVDNRCHPINLNICSVGTLNESLVNPREVFKASILSNAAGVILLHNHPSGGISPSEEDIATTKRLGECGKLLGIEILDHIIVAARTGDYISLRKECGEDFPYINECGGDRPLEDILMKTFFEESDTYEAEDMAHRKGDRVYLNVHNDYAKLGIESSRGDGQTYNSVTLPKGTVVDGKNLSGGTIYPLDMYIYPNKYNANLTTVQFKPDQDIQVNFRNGQKVKVKAEDLCEAVDAANKKYLSQRKEITRSKDKDYGVEL